MKGIFSLIIIFIVSCSPQSKNSNKDNLIIKNGLKISSEIISDIKSICKKNPEKNSVIRYKRSKIKKEVFESYDSIALGIKFKFVSEDKANKVIDKYFNKIKNTKNYLYLTNLGLDKNYDSYYDIVIAPFKNQWELIKFVRTEPVNYDLTNEDVINWFKTKRSEFEFDIIVADVDRIEIKILTKPDSYSNLAKDIYKFCPDVIDQGYSNMEELIKFLNKTNRMWFWWD